MITDFTVEKGKFTDIPAIIALCVAAISNIDDKYYTIQQRRAWSARIRDAERWNRAIREDDFLIVRYDRKIAGLGSLKNKNCIDFLFVDPSFQKQGIAKKIYSALEQHARTGDAKVISAYVSKAARRFFEQQGFILIAEKSNLINGIVLINYRMQKLLE